MGSPRMSVKRSSVVVLIYGHEYKIKGHLILSEYKVALAKLFASQLAAETHTFINPRCLGIQTACCMVGNLLDTRC